MSIHSDIFSMIISATLILLVLLAFIISLLFLYQNRQGRHLLEIRKMKADYENEILKTQLEISEKTFKHISLELHDNVSQVLSLANLSLSSIEVSEDATRKKLDNILDLLGKAIGDIRNVSKTLDPENIQNRGLKSMVELELDLMSKSGRFKTDLVVRGDVVSLPVEKELVIYRMVQETLNNVIKHSDASIVRVIFEYTSLGLGVQIHDNGIGFDTLAANDDPGMGAGLRNMKNRARLVGASLDISSLRHKGTSVTIQVAP
jgi:two-component system, NarL family, sensor kinase